MDDEIVDILTQATGDALLARMVSGLHRLAVTASSQSRELSTLKSAIDGMAPPDPTSPEEVPHG
jgi:hypothetical protein